MDFGRHLVKNYLSSSKISPNYPKKNPRGDRIINPINITPIEHPTTKNDIINEAITCVKIVFPIISIGFTYNIKANTKTQINAAFALFPKQVSETVGVLAGSMVSWGRRSPLGAALTENVART